MEILKKLNALFFILGIFVFTGCGSSSETIKPMETENVLITSTLPLVQIVETATMKIVLEPTLTIEPTSTVVFDEPTFTPTLSFRYDQSVLSDIQRKNLNIESQKFLAYTEDDANYIARNLKFLLNDGHASNMCGPLAIAQLRNAKLLSKNVNLSDFWLLEPYQFHFKLLLDNIFPTEEYQRIRIETPINEIDYLENPLFTGDFVYLYYGEKGTFEHIFTVTRIDNSGKAYTITNVFNGTDYLIQEKMLYDPNNIGDGLFYDYTDSSNWKIGFTGFGGMQIWRPITPIVPVDETLSKFWTQMDSILDQYGDDWYVMIKEIDGEVLYTRNAFKITHPASTIKIPLAISFLNVLEKNGVGSLTEYLETKGIEGILFRELMYEMIVNSDENATYILRGWVEENTSIAQSMIELEMYQTSIEPRFSTANDLSNILENLFLGKNISPEGQKLLLYFMHDLNEKDVGRLSELLPKLSEGTHLYNKRGSLINDTIVVADIGIIETQISAYVLSFIGSSVELEEDGKFQQMGNVIGEAALLFWETFVEK